MARPMAGVRAKSIIITLPGSTKGATENLEAIIHYLPHACVQAAGANSRRLHANGRAGLPETGRDDAVQSGVVADDGGHLRPPTHPESPTDDSDDNGFLNGRLSRIRKRCSPHRSRSSSASRSTSPATQPPTSPDLSSSRRARGRRYYNPSLDHTARVRASGEHGKSVGRHTAFDDAHGHSCGHNHAAPRPHTHGHRSNDPSTGPTRRHRTSPYPAVSVDEALRSIAAHARPLHTVELPVDDQLVGYALARDVLAAEPVPAFRASIVDGYALAFSTQLTGETRSTKGEYPVMAVSHARSAASVPKLAPGEVARVTTGAAVPEGAEAVVMVEDTELVATTADEQEEAVVSILAEDIRPGENIREPGSDVAADSLVLRRHDRISAHGGDIGLLASVGLKSVTVFRRPTVGVLSTGDEVVSFDHSQPKLRDGQIRDSNRPSLIACLKAWGYPVVDLGIARDTPFGQLERSLREGFRGTATRQEVDVIVTTGGVSMGELDLLKPTIERQLGGTIHFGRVAMKPGKPCTFATIPFKATDGGSRQDRLLFGLPGNPASALVTLHLFVLPALRLLSGYAPPIGLTKVIVTLQESINRDSARTEYHRARVTANSSGRLVARSTGGQRSSRVGSFRYANALLVIEPGEQRLDKGDQVSAVLLGDVNGRLELY
ncbi:hypothetical protein KEM52_000010 [Ascosphaera acerosa]|nr:hypothetical protein KEM52_000010 [Ascosphaera acerosa]